uniref:EF-hand domain-containing protein n=1 Tax=Oryza brachyantha TaxID=4533 RepID=J3LU32_ORYBR
MSQLVATIEYCGLAVSVSSLLIRFVLHPLVKDAILMSRAALRSASCAILGLLAHDDSALVAAVQPPTPMRRQCERCARGGGLSRHDALTEGKVAGEGELREAFYVFDRDEDGYVGAAELWNVLRRLGMAEGARYGDCVRMIAAYDGDGDGRISFPEFRAMMENAV